MIVKGGNAQTLTYTLTLVESFRVASISADVNTTASLSDSSCDAILRDNAGQLIARSRSSQTLRLGQLIVMTFAPNLPDSETLQNVLGSDVITSGLADTLLPPGGSVAVSVSDAAARITQMRIWAEDAAEGGTTLEDELETLGRWMFVPGTGP
jgi:hypothetical protein